MPASPDRNGYGKHAPGKQMPASAVTLSFPVGVESSGNLFMNAADHVYRWY
jgi:hypothetical protein